MVSGNVGDHGTAVMLARSGMMEAADIQSDCMPLNQLAEAALNCGGVRVLRDPTRGGVATTLNEFVENRSFSIELEERAIPVAEGVASACEILGLDPLYCANEGKMLIIAERGCRGRDTGGAAREAGRRKRRSDRQSHHAISRKGSTENVPGRDAHSGKAHWRAASENLLRD